MSTTNPSQDKTEGSFQQVTKEVVTGKFANIMKTMAEKSAGGSLPHTKYLFEIGGVKEELRRAGQASGEPSLADLLLAEVEKQRAREAAIVEAALLADVATESGKTTNKAAGEGPDRAAEQDGHCGAIQQ